MNECLSLISIRVCKIGNAGWTVDLSPGSPMLWPPVKTKAEAMRFARSIQKAAKDFNSMDESDCIREAHRTLKQELMRRVSPIARQQSA